MEAVFTLLLAWIAFREHVDVRLFVGAVAIVAGALLLSWQGDLGNISWGAILIALASVIHSMKQPSTAAYCMIGDLHQTSIGKG